MFSQQFLFLRERQCKKVPIEKLEVLNNFVAIVVAMDQQHGT